MRAWAEINLDNLTYNIEKIREFSQNRDIMAIIKADAYGMGAVTIAEELSLLGIENFGVSSLEEGIELRQHNIQGNILILAGIYNDEIYGVKEYNLQVAVTNFSQLELFKNHKEIPLHLKVDTGMGRVGFKEKDALKALEYAKENNLNLVGVYSHLSVADEPGKDNELYTLHQLEIFNTFENEEKLKYRHILNSGGILKYSHVGNSNLVRAGIILYGLYGEGNIKELKRVFTLKSRVLFLKEIEEEMDISYGRIGKAHKGDMIGTISIGYADGFRREFSNNGTVEILGEKCPVIGKVCMDMTMVRIPEKIKKLVKVGQEVIVMGEDIYEKSKSINISVYEMFTGLSRRVSRVYIKNGVPKPHIINNLIGSI
ncbi:alanine racemase [Cetobacterium ceti]|uniref:Alanine racemase n=1 Tax=Cetobacterium ceti TaxID=180163 RepID=A0A1T4KW09_9FUSO|nr:alanine racemase [Cetobacterium ceti]SJZ46538.1 alanine racemase [Cetobacterium ceti]